ncbi:unnamed protein product [Gongylonema pulchrum]|uniref:Secreted protein n=1 Tax=Gongylonema pulchrum TaxID=637853 RepID=A0A183ETQ5_9BILA|nr:unnamed protein product [Gongylonema pulchrum]
MIAPALLVMALSQERVIESTLYQAVASSAEFVDEVNEDACSEAPSTSTRSYSPLEPRGSFASCPSCSYLPLLRSVRLLM